MSGFELANQFLSKDIEGIFYLILRFLQYLKIPFIIISLFLLAGILYFAVFTNYLYYRYFEQFEEYSRWKTFKNKAPKKKEKQQEERIIPKPIKKLKPLGDWERIFEKAESFKDIDCKLALVDADRLLNKKLEELGISGRNIDERIKQIENNFSSQEIEEFNKARNLLKEIFINEKRRVSRIKVKEAIAIYKKMFDSVKS